MSINDSSALIDSPAAGRLGENRALYFNEEQGKTEKFRPYGLPDQAWLDRARDQLHAKAKPAGYNIDHRPSRSATTSTPPSEPEYDSAPEPDPSPTDPAPSFSDGWGSFGDPPPVEDEPGGQGRPVGGGAGRMHAILNAPDDPATDRDGGASNGHGDGNGHGEAGRRPRPGRRLRLGLNGEPLVAWSGPPCGPCKTAPCRARSPE